MCEFCTKHGEGKKWYLNIENYAKELLNEKLVKEFFRQFVGGANEQVSAVEDFPLAAFFQPSITPRMKRLHFGQVVPVEDVGKILRMTASITRLPCACLWEKKKKEQRVCLGVSMHLPAWFGELDLDYFGSPDIGRLEKIGKSQAINFVKDLEEKNNLIHSVWTLGTPFIIGICNCDIKHCLGLRTTVKLSMQTMFRAEYIARIDPEKCTGCKACRARCQFKAIARRSGKKYFVDPAKCFGCGVCRAVCPEKAITLFPRVADKQAKDLW